jgi:succinyl-CoA synthetase beta subunit
VSVFALDGPILLMGTGAGDMMRNINALKECIQSLVLSTPIGLNNKDPLVEEALNKVLEITKFLKHLRLVF